MNGISKLALLLPVCAIGGTTLQVALEQPPDHPCGAIDRATAGAILHAMDTLRNLRRARPTSQAAPRHGSDLAEDGCVGGPDVLEP